MAVSSGVQLCLRDAIVNGRKRYFHIHRFDVLGPHRCICWASDRTLPLVSRRWTRRDDERQFTATALSSALATAFGTE